MYKLNLYPTVTAPSEVYESLAASVLSIANNDAVQMLRDRLALLRSQLPSIDEIGNALSVPAIPPDQTTQNNVSQRRKKSAHADTRYKIKRLAEFRADAIAQGRPIPKKTGKYSACGDIRIDPKTVRQYAPRLYEEWDNPEYVWAPTDYIEDVERG